MIDQQEVRGARPCRCRTRPDLGRGHQPERSKERVRAHRMFGAASLGTVWRTIECGGRGRPKTPTAPTSMSSSRHTQAGLEPELRDAVLQLVLERGLERRDEAFQLSSGEWSHDYVDAKRVLSRGTDLVLVSRAVIAVAATLPAVFDAAGG